MRMRFWRRFAVALALVLGIGVAAPTAPASATPSSLANIPVAGSTSPGAGGARADDWWWGP